ncbi:hypothetical protein [Microbacterium elymi]|uniref:Uncharacterized protein n=1 Tax=Microbacterium elymi TaxID=2909587 RepID=A0ABY5NH00_9MICO|nr:hypothetical protein [Microbacterium elymi]UUT34391.1 hypothetical protein L2X98_27640 [Microbacterium elymi]
MLDFGHPRDLVMIGAIFGVAAFMWAGWAQESPPAQTGWRVVLGALSLLGVALAALSIPLAIKNWGAGTAIDPHTRAFVIYIIVFWAEFVIAGVLAFVVIRAGRSDLVAPLILAIVGIHFFALAVVFGQPVAAPGRRTADRPRDRGRIPAARFRRPELLVRADRRAHIPRDRRVVPGRRAQRPDGGIGCRALATPSAGRWSRSAASGCWWWSGCASRSGAASCTDTPPTPCCWPSRLWRRS